MNARPWITAALLLLLVGILGLALFQQQSVADLKAQHLALKAGYQQFEAVPPPNPAADTAPENGLSDPEHLELLRLRGEITALNDRLRNLGQVEEQHQQLRQRLALGQADPSSLGGADTLALMPGFISPATAEDAGQATPEAALETFLHRISQRDLEGFRRVLVPAMHAELEAEIEQGGLDAVFAEVAKFPGVLITGRTELPDGSVQLQMTFFDTASGGTLAQQEKARFVLINGEWRMDPR